MHYIPTDINLGHNKRLGFEQVDLVEKVKWAVEQVDPTESDKQVELVVELV